MPTHLMLFCSCCCLMFLLCAAAANLAHKQAHSHYNTRYGPSSLSLISEWNMPWHIVKRINLHTHINMAHLQPGAVPPASSLFPIKFKKPRNPKSDVHFAPHAQTNFIQLAHTARIIFEQIKAMLLVVVPCGQKGVEFREENKKPLRGESICLPRTEKKKRASSLSSLSRC